jgi:hypothetical protein
MRVWFLIGWVAGAALTGVSLYMISYEVERMEGELAALSEDIARSGESIHALQAEWSYLARPDRIAELSATYLPELEPVLANRIGRLEDVPLNQPDVLDVLPPEELARPASFRKNQ